MNRPDDIPEDIWNDAQRVYLFGVSPVAVARAILNEREFTARSLLKCSQIYEDGPGERNRGAASALRQFADDLIQSKPVVTVPQLLRKAGAHVED